MGIPSLNIGIKIKFDFPFLCHHLMTSYKYSKYPGPQPRKGAYLWPMSLFLTPRPRKRPFFWPPFTIQSGHIRGRQLNCVKAVWELEFT